MSYVNQDIPPGQSHAVRNHKTYRCGLCDNPYPYLCQECNMEITSAVIETTARDMGLPVPEQQKPIERVFVGSGDIMTWEMGDVGAASSDCCSCECHCNS